MKIIVACSGGPDSMALLDMERREGHEIVICHVNYKKRKSADRDEKYVNTYCQKYDIPVYTLYPVYPGDENFQAWARDVRYDFFEETARKENVKHIYIAHQKDDVIETYFFQKQRNMLCDTYGLMSVSSRKEFTLVRPLLKYEKKDLEAYCQSHLIPYGVDESNLSNDYTRNQIRHSQIDFMTSSEKDEWMEKIERENQAWAKKREQCKKNIQQKGMVPLLNEEEAWLYLDLYLDLPYHLSKKHLYALVEQLKRPCLIDLKTHWLERHLDQILVEEKTESKEYVFNSIEEMKKFPFFQDFGKTIEGMYLQEDDFPVLLRNARDADEITLRFGNKKVHRFFVDRKIPRIHRMRWCVVENAAKEIVFVPGIGCDVAHFSYQPNVFMLQLWV